VFGDPLFILVDASRIEEARDAAIGFDLAGRLLFVMHIDSPFAQFFSRFMKLWQNIFICRHGNTNTHNENRTGRRYSAAISADGQDEYSWVTEQAFSDARELARAKFRGNSGHMAGLYPERRRSSLELCTRLGGGNPNDTNRLSESGWFARIGF
jgi:hypothetical protein